MRILFTIPHFYKPTDDEEIHLSLRKDPQPRIQGLTNCVASLHQYFGNPQGIFDFRCRTAVSANYAQTYEIDIVICTTGKYHILNNLPLPPEMFTERITNAEPMFLGFECQEVMRELSGSYDYYCFLEDDLILRDPWFFIKLDWFTKKYGDLKLLQPNRYEVSVNGFLRKAYIDGHLGVEETAKFQDVQDEPEIIDSVLSQSIIFYRPFNPHSGCYFLNARQLEIWMNKRHFLDRDTSFVGPLESAASLGIMRTFKVYKPAPQCANFLEIQHFGSAYLYTAQSSQPPRT